MRTAMSYHRHIHPAEELIREPARRSSVLQLGRADTDLHICPECRSELVHPTQWAPVDLNRWRVELRCPDCEYRVIDVYEQSVLDRFDVLLDGATQSLLDDLARLERCNMEEELDRLVDALAQDSLLPEDF